jgi:uncharacterized membrane protein
VNYPYGLLPHDWHWIATVLCITVLGVALLSAPWHRFKSSYQMNVYFGTCVFLLVMWTIRAVNLPGLEYHYLGATLLSLMFGWRLAIVGISMVLIGTVINGSADWQTFPMNLLVMGVVPVSVSRGIRTAEQKWLPAHFFIYIFVDAFFGAALAMLAVVLSGSAILWIGTVYSFDRLITEYLQLAPLLMFPEAFITGFLTTIMVVYRPEWVSSFDDSRYLENK